MRFAFFSPFPFLVFLGCCSAVFACRPAAAVAAAQAATGTAAAAAVAGDTGEGADPDEHCHNRRFDEAYVGFRAWALDAGRPAISAETPGHFSALPARAYAKYAPEAAGNAAEFRVRVVEEE